MIVKKVWLQVSQSGLGPEWTREGFYLFGIVPLYIRDCGPLGIDAPKILWKHHIDTATFTERTRALSQ